MPPFVLCNVTNCAKANVCYRYLAVPEINQLYHDFSTLCCNNNGYNYFMKIRETDKIAKLDSPAIETINAEIESIIEGDPNVK